LTGRIDSITADKLIKALEIIYYHSYLPMPDPEYISTEYINTIH